MTTRRLPRPPVGPAATRPISVIVRALPGALRDGRLAGMVEVVDTGDLVPIGTVADLLALLARLADEQAARR